GASAENVSKIITGRLLNRTNAMLTALYEVTPRSGNCEGTMFTLTVFVNPTPEIVPMSVTVCSGLPFAVTPTDMVNGIVPNPTIYRWDVPTYSGTMTGGVSAENVATTISGLLLNRTNVLRTATYMVTPMAGNCEGATFSVTVFVNPTPEITAMSTTTCNGVQFEVSPANTRDGIVPFGTQYRWNVPITTASVVGGQSDSGKLQIRGTLTNLSNQAQEAYYTVTPTSGSCEGVAFALTVYLNPTPVISAMSTVTCSGVMFNVTPVNDRDGIVPIGTKYKWGVPTYQGTITGGQSNSNQSGIFGLLRNRTNVTRTATYIVTPSIGNCGEGTPFTLTVTIPPTPEIVPMSVTVCSGLPFAVTPTDVTNGIVPNPTFYRWGIPTYSGTMTGGVSAENVATTISGLLLNRTNVLRTATYEVIPNAGACEGKMFTVTVFVNPTPEVRAMSTTVCSGVV
ncbi:MAG: PKD-like domain-containing protein, partial [bacterium]